MANLNDQFKGLIEGLDDPIRILEDYGIGGKVPKLLESGAPPALTPPPQQGGQTPAPVAPPAASAGPPTSPSALLPSPVDAAKNVALSAAESLPGIGTAIRAGRLVGRSEVGKTFVGGLGTDARLAGKFTEALGTATDSPSIASAGRQFAEVSSKAAEPYAPKVPGIENIRWDNIGHTVDDISMFVQGQAGSGAATMLPSIAGSALTRSTWGAIPGSYVLNAGDTFDSIQQDPEIQKLIATGKLSAKTVAETALAAGVPQALLDRWGLESFVGSASRPLKAAITKELIKRALVTGTVEGSTEAAQEAISIAAQEVLGGDVSKKEAVLRLANNFLGGFILGAPGGGVGTFAAAEHQKMLQDRLNDLGKDSRPTYVKGIEALVNGEPQVAEGAQILGQELAPANQNSIFENKDETGLVFGEYLDMNDALAQAQYLKDLGRGTIKTEEVPQTDEVRYNAAVQRQITRRGTRNAFRVLRGGESPTIVEGAEPLASRSGEEPETFYSQLQRTVEDKKFPSKGLGPDLLNKIRNSPGVKAEEIEWTGLPELLSGKKQVTKEEILQHLEENQVQVEESLYGTSQGSLIRWTDPLRGQGILQPDRARRVIDQALRYGGEAVDEYGQFRVSRTPSGRYNLESTFDAGTPTNKTFVTLDEALQNAQEQADAILATGTENVGAEEGFAGPPKYGSYVLPGSRKNYREFIFRWAPPLPKKIKALKEEMSKANTLLRGLRETDPQKLGDLINQFTNDPARIRATRQILEAETEQGRESYTEPHFGKDVLAWVRMTERVDEAGNKILFLEELQSKWHQLGRGESYTQRVQKWELVRPLKGKETAEEFRATNRLTPDGLIQLNWGDEETMRADHDFMRAAASNDQKETDVIMRPTNETIRVQGAVPNAPFKSNWLDLLVKRMIRYAADQGYSRIAWTTGQMQQERYGDHETTAPVAAIYDKVLPPIARKWAKTVGGTVGTTALKNDQANKFQVWDLQTNELAASFATEGNAQTWINDWFRNDPEEYRDKFEIRPLSEVQRVPFIDLPEKLFEAQNKPSFPLFKRPPKGKKVVSTGRLKKLGDQAERLLVALDSIASKIGIDENYTVQLMDNFDEWATKMRHVEGNELGLYYGPHTTKDGTPLILINLSAHSDPIGLWSTITHEFGHMVVDTALRRAPLKTQLHIANAFEAFLQSTRPTESLRSLQLRSLSAARVFESEALMSGRRTSQLANLSKADRDYWTMFEEWFAEQVSKWATTDEKPLSIVDKFFAGLGRRLKALLQRMVEKFKGQTFQPDAAVKEWLDSFMTQSFDLGKNFYAQINEESQTENQEALDAVDEGNAGAAPVSEASLAARNVIEGLEPLMKRGPNAPSDHWRQRMKADAAHLDRIKRRHSFMMGLLELQERFKHIGQVNEYTENMQAQMLMQQVLTDEAEVVRKAWDKLAPAQNKALANVMDDFMNMSYRTKDEIRDGAARFPTKAEFQVLMRQHSLDATGGQVFQQIYKHFRRLINVYEQVLLDNVSQTALAPDMQLLKEAAIQKQFEAIRSRPFTPLMHFGEHAVEVRDSANNLVQREFYDNVKTANKALFALNRKLPQGYRATAREFHKESLPFINFPTALQKAIDDQLELTDDQAADLKAMLEGDPVPLFRHQLMNRKGEFDYPHRLKRAFAWYSTRGATYIARLKFNPLLSKNIKQLREEAKIMPDSRLRDGLAHFLEDHKKEQYSNRTDFAQIRAAGFFMYLGFMVPSAALNLTQAFFGTTPFLMAKFGPVAAAFVLDAGTSRVQYWRKGTIEKLTTAEGRALDRLIKEKIVDESMAPELAGLSEGHNLLDRTGKFGPALSRGFVGFKHAASFLFSIAEKGLRRNAALSAYRLAMSFPNSPFVAESVRMNQIKFNELLSEGWQRSEAAAYVTAQRTVRQTQYEYARYAQPKFMRGLGRPLFMFKRFQHATLFMLYNHPKMLLYWLPLTLFFGGLMGIPGMEELRGISKWLARWIFGADFDIEKEAREFTLNAFGGDKEVLGRKYFLPDLVTDGLSKYGFGIPHMLDLLGGTVGVDVPFPTLDRSRALGVGKLIPLDFDALANMNKKNALETVGKETIEALGPVFGWALTAFRQAGSILENPGGKGSDKGLIPREYEPMAPRILARLSQAWRAYRDQSQTDASGNTIVQYDTRDPEQGAELIAKGLGYQPLRETQKYEQIRKQGEVIQMWTIRRQLLLDQYWTAIQTKDPQEIKSVNEAITKFNIGLPPEAAGQKITRGQGGTLERSVQSRKAVRVKRTQGKALNKKDQSLVDEIKRLYPGSDPVSVQRVR